MPRRTNSRAARGATQAPVVEWIGGIAELPITITGEGPAYHPEGLLWLTANGLVLGHSVERPGEALDRACDHLRETIARPMIGRPHRPTRVRVASAALAAVLRDGIADIEVVIAPTPEVDEVLAVLAARSLSRGKLVQSYLAPWLEPAAVGALLEAAADLYRAQPWRVAPTDSDLLRVTIPTLGLHDGAVSIMGQIGQSYGLVLYPGGVRDFQALIEVVSSSRDGERPPLPPNIALNYDRRDAIPPQMRVEVRSRKWPVAGPSAWPWLMLTEPDWSHRPATARELTIFEALARAVTQVLAEPEALVDGWFERAPCERTVTVATHAGAHAVTIAAVPRGEVRGQTPDAGPLADSDDEPWYDEAGETYVPPPSEVLRQVTPDELLAELKRLGPAITGDEAGMRDDAEEMLLELFAGSPEASVLGRHWPSAVQALMDHAVIYLDTAFVNLDSRQLRSLVVDVFPREAVIEPNASGDVVAALRFFYAFLARTSSLPHADACKLVLDQSCVEELEQALADPSCFSEEKVAYLEEHPAVPVSAAPPVVAGGRADKKTKKNKRKSQRKARRRK